MFEKRAVLLPLALFAVYVIWGSTYYGMHVALESFPPFWMGGIRFVIAGALLLLWQTRAGAPMPTPRQWWNATLLGVLFFAIGNGFVAVSQRWIGSALSAMVIASMPLWAALWSIAFRERPTRGEAVGLVIGFCGVAVLGGDGDLRAHGPLAMLILLAPIAWSFGSLWGKRLDLADRRVAPAAQMLMGGAVMLAIAPLVGETLPSPQQVSPRSWIALVYLTVVGSMLGFSAYDYLLRTTRPALATSYAYVNPIIAVGIGWLAGESMSTRMLIAGAIVIVGVVWLNVATLRDQGRQVRP